VRYHTHIVKPGEVETYHDQVGYWLWEPATGHLIQTLAIPRGQVAMAFGRAARDAKTFDYPSAEDAVRDIEAWTSMADSAADVIACAREFRKPPLLIGWSMGGLVSLMRQTTVGAVACVGLAPRERVKK